MSIGLAEPLLFLSTSFHYLKDICNLKPSADINNLPHRFRSPAHQKGPFDVYPSGHVSSCGYLLFLVKVLSVLYEQ